MPRGDELNEELLFSDRDDDADDLGYGGGGSSSDDDDDEEDGGGGGGGMEERERLWDRPEDVDEDDEEGAEAGGDDAVGVGAAGGGQGGDGRAELDGVEAGGRVGEGLLLVVRQFRHDVRDRVVHRDVGGEGGGLSVSQVYLAIWH